MRNKRKLLIPLTYGLLVAVTAAFAACPSFRAETGGEAAVPAVAPREPGPDAWWSGQADAADQNGQPDAAHEYRARATAYANSLQSQTAANGKSALAAAVPPLAEAALYVRTPRSAPQKLAKHEPASGVYLGMLGADRRVGYDFSKIEGVYEKKHAMYLAYVGWRKFQTDTSTYFPKRTADRVKALGGALQIGWEPRYGLDDVKDDEYVRTFAREAKASGIPIFLRYASEMNGNWVPWYGDPQKYVEKFRLIHSIMAEEAPNVAMVWSPNFVPANNIDEYYPGDAYVDWVGFSLYATPLTGGEEDLEHTVIEYFAPLYANYSHKPIMIAEGAVAHTVLKTNQSYHVWGEGQLGYMYAFLPRMFPMVKAMTYFNFGRAQALRSNMEYVYDLGESALMDGMYKRITRSDMFLDYVEQGVNAAPHQYVPLSGSQLPAGKQKVMMYARMKDVSTPFAVALYQGDRRLGISYEMPWEIDVDIPAADASKPWRIVAFNKQMEPIAASPGTAIARTESPDKINSGAP
ncbi:glycoside hydrolase family 26 protein [Paenibacillus allorhizosphaerae]|uniref:GH26 domain-containing protein n=1 Tax=Paenibacillus allorhizosphaerae TaxID=2849866 RepID=A0ABM8VFI3_9BACL|nr:glycosyl hydrolase [Paenibacillus allorhizosphaerae]CAG7635118.1 hypothetical protein PAECIP111802_02100 [Paenibacillus allorhizosphaerae]